jgi:hypothetical protein
MIPSAAKAGPGLQPLAYGLMLILFKKAQGLKARILLDLNGPTKVVP